jgi:hypothetical protein
LYLTYTYFDVELNIGSLEELRSLDKNIFFYLLLIG